MELESITAELIEHALRLYLSCAWPGREGEKRPGLELEGRGDRLLTGFTDESKRDGDRRFVLRLGNSRYPHMKFVIEEYLLPGEYVFAVDTHDQLELNRRQHQPVLRVVLRRNQLLMGARHLTLSRRMLRLLATIRVPRRSTRPRGER